MRSWLEKNKIFFETVTASLLSIMAVLISVLGYVTTQRQTELTRIQALVAQQQLEIEKRKNEPTRTGEWQRLRDGIWAIFDQFPKSGVTALDSLTREQKQMWFARMRVLLDAQSNNAVLTENRKCLGKWRNAISGAKMTSDTLASTDTSSFKTFASVEASGIHKDIMCAWNDLIVNSNEVSPFGGQPEEEKPTQPAGPVALPSSNGKP